MSLILVDRVSEQVFSIEATRFSPTLPLEGRRRRNKMTRIIIAIRAKGSIFEAVEDLWCSRIYFANKTQFLG